MDSLLSKSYSPKDDTKKTKVYLEISEIYKNNNSDSALKYVELALKSSQKTQNQDLIAQTYFSYGIIVRDANKYKEAISSLQKAVSLFEKTGNKQKIGRVYSSMGLVYKKMGDVQKVEALTKKGIEYGLKAVEMLNSIKDSSSLASAYNNLGITYRDMKDFKNAKKCYVLGIAIAEKFNKTNAIGATLNSNLGQVFMDNDKNYDAAISQFKNALEIFQKFNDKKGIEAANRNIAQANIYKKDFKQAIVYGQKSVEIAKEVKDNHRSFNSYKMLSDAFQGAGMYREAFENFKISKRFEDSTLRTDKLKSIAEIETKYQTEKKEIEIKNLNEKNEIQRNQLILAVLGLVLFLGLSTILFFQYQKIKESRAKISEQSEQLKLMMKELHHRVKNNLAIVSSLLRVQSSRIEDEQAVQAVKQGRQRIEAMSLIHQRLYQTDRISNINIREYINDLAESLMNAYGYKSDDFDLELNIEKEELDVDVAMPIGLIINELLTNSFKYAYTNIERPSLKINLKTDNGLTLEVQDNGKGIDLEKWEKAKDSFGKKLIKGLSKQLGGTMTVENRNGAYYSLHIPKESLKAA